MIVTFKGYSLEGEHEGTFWSAENVIHLSLGGGYKVVFVCETSLSHTLEIHILYCLCAIIQFLKSYPPPRSPLLFRLYVTNILF